MSTDSDDQDMSQPLDERATDALLAGRSVPGESALSALVADVLALLDAPAPVPSAALAELLVDGLVPDTALLPTLPRQARRPRLLPIPLAAGALAVAGGLFGAATANALPPPAQRIVSDTVGTLTPLHLPRPASKPKPAVRPAPGSEPSEDPTHATYEPTEPTEPSESPEPVEPSERTAGDDQDSDRKTDQDGDNNNRDNQGGPGDGESRDTPPADDQDGPHDSEGHDGDSTGGEQHDRSGPANNGPGTDERG